MGRSEHWDDRYRSIGAESVSWFEEHPAASLAMLDRLGITPERSVIDVGGGASTLVDHLLQRGHHDLAVLDVSAVALDAAQERLEHPSAVTWITHDLLTWAPDRHWYVWHDRAVVHFLVSDEDRATYAALLRRVVGPEGAFVVGTFAEDGPTQCSALPVRRHRPGDLVELLGDVDVVEQRRHIHRTPGGTDQPFNWVAGHVRASARQDDRGPRPSDS
jgi:hypothetical protein